MKGRNLQVRPLIHRLTLCVGCAVLAQLAILTMVQPSSASLLGGLRWGGGRVIAEPKVYAVYWGGEWRGIGPNPGPDRFSDSGYTESSVRNYIDFFLKNVGGSLYFNTLTQYCDKTSNFFKSSCGPPLRPGAHLIRNRANLLTDERIWIDATSNAPWPNMPWQTANDEARRAVEHFRQNGQFRDSDADNAIFMIFTPPGKSPTRFGVFPEANLCARYWEDPQAPRKSVILVPYNPETRWCDRNRVNTTSDGFGRGWLDGYSIWMGRMLAGAITNPDGRTGWMTRLFGRSGLDIAESCALPSFPPRRPRNVRFGRVPNSEEMAVAPLWSNQEPTFLLPMASECVFQSRAISRISHDEGEFGSVVMGQDSATQTFTLRQASNVELHTAGPDREHPDDPHAAASEGDHGSDFIVDSTDCDNMTMTIELQSDSCQVKVTFRPRATGERRARLHFHTDAGWMRRDPIYLMPQPPPPELRFAIPLRGTGQPASESRPGLLRSSGGHAIVDPKFFLDFWHPAWDEQRGFTVTSPSGTDYTSRQIMTYNRRFFEQIGASGWLNTTTRYCKGNIGTTPFTFCSEVPAESRTMIANPSYMHSTAELLCDFSPRCWVDTAPNTQEEPAREPSPGMPLSRVQAEARRAASHFGNPDPANAIYVIYTPPGKAPTGFGAPSSDPLCATHASTNGGPPYYIYVPFVTEYPACRLSQGPDDAFGHGYLDADSFWSAAMAANAITDPTGPAPPSGVRAGWRDDNGYEIATKCVDDLAFLTRRLFGPYTFTVPRLWSNGTVRGVGRCVFESTASTEVIPVDNIDFGEVPVTARAGRTRVITLKNSGPVELHIGRVWREGASDFTLENDRCSNRALQALPPRDTCTVSVQFRPSRPLRREKWARVNFEHDGWVSPEVTFVFGTPVSPIEVKRAGATFGKRAIGSVSAPQRIEIENTGDESVELRRPVLVGGDSGDFRIASNGCEDVTLDPERPQCAIEVAFAPQEREGEEEGEERWRVTELEIRNSADDEPDAVRLWGEVADPPVTLDPRSWNFGEQRLRIPSYTKWFQVKNNGEGDLTVTAASITPGNPNEFSTYNMCAISGPVGPGRSCSVSVQFSPTALGLREATLRVAYRLNGDTEDRFVTAPVSGRGIGETFVPADPLVPELIGPLPSDPLYLEFSPWG